jgi:hypothetical protein
MNVRAVVDSSMTAQLPGALFSSCAPFARACRKTDWQPLPDVTVPPSFFRARRCPATPTPRGLVATLTPSRPEDAIDEQGPNRAFAANVAISGDIVVAGSGEKAVYVFENGPDGWSEAARIEPFEPSDIPGRGRFGTQVDVSGARAVILDDHAVRIVEHGDGTWTRVSTIVPPEPEARVLRVAIAGSTVVLTVVDFSNSAQPQRAHVYEESGGAWRKSATISLPGRDPFEFVSAMHLSEERVAVLVLGGTGGGMHWASIEVVERRSGEWLPTSSVAILYSPIDSAHLAFALAGDDLVVGSAPDAVRSSRAGTSRSLFSAGGTVRGLTREGEGWTVTEELTACSPDVGRFGQVLAVSGDTLVVGAPDGAEGGSRCTSSREAPPVGRRGAGSASATPRSTGSRSTAARSSWDRPSSTRRRAGPSRSSTSTRSSSCRPYPAPTMRRGMAR